MSWEPGKPSQNENDYFARRDADWLKEQRAQIDARRKEQSKTILCPRDQAALEERAFEGVRVDVCPVCHGLWLDAGELAQVVHLPPRTLQQVVSAVGALPERR